MLGLITCCERLGDEYNAALFQRFFRDGVCVRSLEQEVAIRGCADPAPAREPSRPDILVQDIHPFAIQYRTVETT